VIPGDRRIILSLDGWSSSNNFKIDYSSRDIFPVGWCKSAGIQIAKVGGPYMSYSRTSNKTLPTTQNENIRQSTTKPKKPTASPTTIDEKNNNSQSKEERRECDDIQTNNVKKEHPIGKIFIIRSC
jgi:hypothetical protein